MEEVSTMVAMIQLSRRNFMFLDGPEFFFLFLMYHARRYSQQIAVGDIIQVQKFFNKSIGVVIDTPTLNSPTYKTLSQYGHVESHLFKDIAFQYPGWAYLPKMREEIPDFRPPAGLVADTVHRLEQVNLTPDVMYHLHQFESILHEKYQSYASKCFSLHKSVAPLERRLPLQSLASRLVDKDQPTPTDLFACFNNFRRGLLFQLDNPVLSLSDPLFVIHSLEKSRANQRLLRSIGQGSQQVKEFYEKMREVVKNSRKGIHSHVELTSFDKELISVLKDSIKYPFFYSELNQFFASTILKKMELYGPNPQLPFDTIRFLKEVGIWFRNEDVSLYVNDSRGTIDSLEDISAIGDTATKEAKWHSIQLTQAGTFEYARGIMDAEAGMKQKVLKPKKAPKFDTRDYAEYKSQAVEPMGMKEYPSRDPLHSLRHEMTDTVYTIDDPTAHELDDGISVERKPNGEEWIHVHIADPTSYIAPNSPLATLAQLRGSSLYLPFRHFPMMPDDLSDKIFNLGVSPTAMTFSARLDSNGNIADYKVTPTVLKNVKLTTYDDVDTCLDWKPFIEKNPVFWVAEYLKKANKVRCPEFSDYQVAELRKLQELLLRHRQHRIDSGAILNDQFNSSIRVLEYPLALSNPVHERTYDQKEPVSSIHLNPYKLTQRSPAHTLVSEAMILAGRIAAKYCQEHSLPVAYRGQPSILEGLRAQFGDSMDLDSVAKKIADVCASKNADNQFIPEAEYRSLLPFMRPAYHSFQPVSHYSMGIQDKDFGGYVKVTSPLRRYQDMLVHWQIQASLLGKKPIFDLGMVQRITTRMESIAKAEKGLSKRSTTYWLLEYLKRQCLKPTSDYIASYSENTPFEFEFHMNPTSQNVYTAYASHDKDIKGRNRMMVTIPSLHGLRSRCLPNSSNSKDEIVQVVVEKVSPLKGFVLWRQIE
jgi:hypothetical protein